MQDEYYSEPDDQSQVSEPSEETYSETETVLIPKSMLGEKQPGEKCTVEVVSVFEDEYEVKVSAEAKTEEPVQSRVDAKIDAMAV